jgi:GT2 family glycosyltransferase
VITPLDEHTFLYEEESIIGVRMEESELKSVYFPRASVIHKHGQSTGCVKAIPYICIVQSELYYCFNYLHNKKYQVLPLYIYRTLGYFLRMLKYDAYRKSAKYYLERTIKEFNILKGGN